MAERIKKSLHIVNFFSHHFLTLKSLEIEWKLEVEIFLLARSLKSVLTYAEQLPYIQPRTQRRISTAQ